MLLAGLGQTKAECRQAACLNQIDCCRYDCYNSTHVKRYCSMTTEWSSEWSKQTCFSQESYNIDVADAAQGLLILTDVI